MIEVSEGFHMIVFGTKTQLIVCEAFHMIVFWNKKLFDSINFARKKTIE